MGMGSLNKLKSPPSLNSRFTEAKKIDNPLSPPSPPLTPRAQATTCPSKGVRPHCVLGGALSLPECRPSNPGASAGMRLAVAPLSALEWQAQLRARKADGSILFVDFDVSCAAAKEVAAPAISTKRTKSPQGVGAGAQTAPQGEGRLFGGPHKIGPSAWCGRRMGCRPSGYTLSRLPTAGEGFTCHRGGFQWPSDQGE